jgi:DNA-binding response OmpR family regulator
MIESPTILVIEDDPAVRTGIVDTLEYGGYRTLEAADGNEGMKMALQATYRLLLLDIVMPGPSGFEILASLKKSRPGQAVIMLSARGEEADRVRGLVDGADDYVVKPFGMKELLARVDAVLRRTHERPSPVASHTIDGATIDLNAATILFADGRKEDMSDKESSLLKYLIEAGGRTVTRAEILRHVWNLDPERIETRTIDMHMAHLRSKLGGTIAARLVTERGKGYRFTSP